MRITKKFTGACCLGRRAYHLRDRPRASSAEVEMANLELLHLEQRFRLRVEHEQTGLPLPPQHYQLLASQPPPPHQAAVVSPAELLPSLFSYQQHQHQHQQQGSVAAAAIPTVVNANNNPWLQQQNSTIPPNLASLVPGLTGNIPNVAAFPGFNLNTMAEQLLLQQNPNERLVHKYFLFFYFVLFWILKLIVHQTSLSQQQQLPIFHFFFQSTCR
jgi:hypothetical protein